MVTDCKSVGIVPTQVRILLFSNSVFWTYSLRVKHIAHNGQNKGSNPFKSKYIF